MNAEILDKIEKYDGKTEIKYINPITNMETLLSYKHKCKNFYYYQCNKRPICKGKLN